MGYNNGAMSAMTADEFETSVRWAITNPYGSGLEDVFGSCERIIRPQEVMFTPCQAAAYRRLGVEAVCLYYSCISFDPETGDGVVVLTTGADGGADRYGIYNICDAINEYIYKVIR